MSFLNHFYIFSNWSNILIALLTFILFYYQRKHSYWRQFGLKGPTPVPFLGTTWKFLTRPFAIVEKELVQEYGKIVGLYEGASPTLIIADPEIIKAISLKDFQYFPQSFEFSSYKHRIESRFPELLYGQEWKDTRSLVTPSLTTGKLRKMFTMLEESADIAIQGLDSELQSSDSVEMKQFWCKYTVDSIFRVCLSISVDSYKTDQLKIYKKMNEMLSTFNNVWMLNLILPKWFIKINRMSAMKASGLEYFEQFTSYIMNERRKTQASSNDVLERFLKDDEGEGKSNPNNTQLSDDDVIGAIIDLLFNGFETSSTLLAWACWRLAFNQEVQDRLYEEVSSMQTMDYDTVSSASYLDAVINETLRMDPPVVENQRICHKRYTLPNTEIVVPVGTRIAIPIYAIHRSPEYWPDPEKFDPDRFSPENKNNIDPFTFIPFGGGYRACLGMRLAIFVSKLALAKAVARYSFYVNDKTTNDFTYDKWSLLLGTKQLCVGVKLR